jgi:hypothetical protein
MLLALERKRWLFHPHEPEDGGNDSTLNALGHGDSNRRWLEMRVQGLNVREI